jgi:hypothetical protein
MEVLTSPAHTVRFFSESIFGYLQQGSHQKGCDARIELWRRALGGKAGLECTADPAS